MPYRRTLTVASVVVLSAGVGLGLVLQPGCQQRPPITGTIDSTDARSRRLTALAVEEAARIPNVDTRLTRQLNLADQQIHRGWSADARTTLAAANTTLRSDDADSLNDHARISGWISISQLARQVDDTAISASACDQAVAQLLVIEDPAQRCQYVMGTANEVHYSRGQSAAADLLAKAGPWAREVDDIADRRRALVSFATALFNLDQYDAGQSVLRQDDDAAWRSDQLLALASRPAQAQGVAADTPAALHKMERSNQPMYGRAVSYESVFKGQKQSKTSENDE